MKRIVIMSCNVDGLQTNNIFQGSRSPKNKISSIFIYIYLQIAYTSHSLPLPCDSLWC